MFNDKKERFKRLATSRTNEVIKKLKILSNCSNKSTYSYTFGEVEKIFNAIERAMNGAKSQFKTSENKHVKFKL